MTVNPLDATQRDDSIPVSDDFYHHVNARWLQAKAAAGAILAFERRLAEASLSPEQKRDPKLTLIRFDARRWRCPQTSGPGSGTRQSAD